MKSKSPQVSSSSNAFVALRSAVSKPSVNEPKAGASSAAIEKLTKAVVSAWVESEGDNFKELQVTGGSPGAPFAGV